LARDADRRRDRRHRRRWRGGRTDRTTAAVDIAGLRLRGDHRRLRGTAASARRPARELADVAALPRRRGRADQPFASARGPRAVPGTAALLPARCRCADQLPAAGAAFTRTGRERDAARRKRGCVMEHFAALVALTLAAGTPLVFAALGELVTEKS